MVEFCYVQNFFEVRYSESWGVVKQESVKATPVPAGHPGIVTPEPMKKGGALWDGIVTPPPAAKHAKRKLEQDAASSANKGKRGLEEKPEGDDDSEDEDEEDDEDDEENKGEDPKPTIKNDGTKAGRKGGCEGRCREESGRKEKG